MWVVQTAASRQLGVSLLRLPRQSGRHLRAAHVHRAPLHFEPHCCRVCVVEWERTLGTGTGYSSWSHLTLTEHLAENLNIYFNFHLAPRPCVKQFILRPVDITAPAALCLGPVSVARSPCLCVQDGGDSFWTMPGLWVRVLPLPLLLLRDHTRKHCAQPAAATSRHGRAGPPARDRESRRDRITLDRDSTSGFSTQHTIILYSS